MLEEKQIRRKPKIALIISSGGLKAIGALALFEFLKENNIEVDLIIGTSGGAILGTSFALDMSSQTVIDLFYAFLSKDPLKKLDYNTILNIFNVPFTKWDVSHGLVKGNALQDEMKNLFKDQRIEDLPIETVIVASDILSGESYIFDEGPIAVALAASASIFPLVPPVYYDGHYLADGALSAPLPVVEAVKRQADIIISMAFWENYAFRSDHLGHSLQKGLSIPMQTLYTKQLALAISMHHAEIVMIDVTNQERVGLTDGHLLPRMIETAEEALNEKKQEILSTIKNFNS
ncbi:MAG: patatin-like phospholipase family protein [Bacteroidota bacterium]